MQKILIIEDEAEIRNGICTLLQDEDYLFVQAENGREGLKILDESINLVILDVMMPEIDGIATCQKIREKSSVPILFLSAKSLEYDKLLGIKSGGDDYMVKPFSYLELNSRIKALLRRYCIYKGKTDGECLMDTQYIEFENIRIGTEMNELLLNNVEVNLTEIEYQILLYLMRRANRTCSPKEIFENVWGEQFFYGANNTITVHIKNLRIKVEDEPQNPTRIITVWGKGYQFRSGAKE